jgi:hypothetical protein
MCEMSDICTKFDLFVVKPLIKTFQLSFFSSSSSLFFLILFFNFLFYYFLFFKWEGGEGLN